MQVLTFDFSQGLKTKYCVFSAWQVDIWESVPTARVSGTRTWMLRSPPISCWSAVLGCLGYTQWSHEDHLDDQSSTAQYVSQILEYVSECVKMRPSLCGLANLWSVKKTCRSTLSGRFLSYFTRTERIVWLWSLKFVTIRDNSWQSLSQAESFFAAIMS